MFFLYVCDKNGKKNSGFFHMSEQYDIIILGAGLYGLYSALFCAKRNRRVLVLEHDDAPFKRATYINQARLHQGYHYPRSLSTALKSAGYFERFNKDFSFCIYRDFEKIYATSSKYSWSDREQFKKFCKAAQIPCEEIHPSKFFKQGMCDGAFRTREYTYDADLLKKYFLQEIDSYPNATIRYGARTQSIAQNGDTYEIQLQSGEKFKTTFLLNATYASTNQVQNLLGLEGFKIKYELCEIILCDVNEQLRPYGITIMDGPFFSIMPFGMTGLHSLTSVTFTPHTTSFDTLPTFKCQERCNGFCTPNSLGNCNDCPAKPQSAYPYMANLAHKYLLDDYQFHSVRSLFSMKPILVSSEIDDSRPTMIRLHTEHPRFISVLSGKINTVYDLDEVLTDV